MFIPRLSAGNLELVLSGWPDSRFVALCNALVWAYAGRSRAALSVAFTENEKAKDLGVDAAVELEDDPVPGPLLNKGWNVFQYKRRNVVSDKLKSVVQLKKELTGAADPELLEHAKREERVLFTMDKGIGNISVYPPERHAGVVLFRPPSAGRGTALDFVRRHLWAVVNYDLRGKLLVVTERGIRLR